MKDKHRREMFVDLYRFAEHCENPPFKPGDIEGNGAWFDKTTKEQLIPFIEKYKDIQIATPLAIDVYAEAERKAAEMNKKG